jgi:hypothetical protein
MQSSKTTWNRAVLLEAMNLVIFRTVSRVDDAAETKYVTVKLKN